MLQCKLDTKLQEGSLEIKYLGQMLLKAVDMSTLSRATARFPWN